MQFKSFEEQERFNTAVWGGFEELFGVTEQLRESKKSTREKEDLSAFYYRYLLSKQGYFPYKKLYSQFVSYANEFPRGNNRLPKLVADLKRFANYSISILSVCKEPDLEVAFKRFRMLEHETPMPLLLHLYDKYEENKNFKPMFLEILRIIESFILRRSILRKRTLRGYGEILTKAIDYAGNPVKLMKYLADKDWPTDQEVKNAMREYPLYQESNSQCRLILEEIERSYGHKEEVNLEDTRIITIEHVMPQTLRESWREMLGKDANKTHKKYLHTLGNLTLTGYNSEMGNRSYKKKREELISSHIELNSYFKKHEQWTEKEILERTNALTDKFIKIWKRPAMIE